MEQAQQECPDWDIVEVNSLAAIDKLPSLGIKYKRIAFEAHNISYSHYLALEAALPNRWQTTEKLTESLRLIKSGEELDLLRKSAAISDQVFTDIAVSLAPGTQENADALLDVHIAFGRPAVRAAVVVARVERDAVRVGLHHVVEAEQLESCPNR